MEPLSVATTMAEFQKESLTLEEANRVRASLGLRPLTEEPEKSAPESQSNREFQKESLSLDETNRLRTSLGLAPLSSDDSAAPTPRTGAPTSQVVQDAESAANFAAHRDAQRARESEVAVRERIAKVQNRRDLARKLRGPTLGDADERSNMSARDWVRAAGRRAKENAERRQREQDELDRALPAEYRPAELQGLRVAHDLDEFTEGAEERVLTLRDTGVLDDAEDELIEAGLDAAARDKANRERKQGAKLYTGLDDDEFQENGASRGVLGKYDHVEGLDRPAPTREGEAGFRLGDDASLSAMDARAHAREEALRAAAAREQQRTSLDYEKNVPVSDYAEVHFKKKPKKRRDARVKVEVNDELPPAPAVPAPMDEESPRPRAPRAAAESLIDDDELAASLARTRRRRAKQSFAKVTPEMVAQNLAAQQAFEQQQNDTTQEPEGTLFDETSEFVRQLGQREADRAAEVAATHAAEAAATHDAEPDAVDGTSLIGVPSAPEDNQAPLVSDEPSTEPSDTLDTAGVPDAEADDFASGGVASALKLLRSQGILEEVSPEQREHEKKQLHYDAWLHERRKEERERERAIAEGRVPNDARENRQRERREAQAVADRYKDYTPDVKLEYHDEFGRTLSTKEAWKRLSHVFHGNAPGHKAQEKRLRRIAEEQRRERMIAGDTSTLTRAFQERSERTGQAHMVLSVGNRDHAPQDIDLGAPQAVELAKPPKPTPPPPRERRAPTPGPDEPSEPPRGPAIGHVSGVAVPAPAGHATDTAPAATKPAFAPAVVQPAAPTTKPAFAPVAAPAAPAAAPSASDAGAAPAPSATEDRPRVRIALGKRKAP